MNRRIVVDYVLRACEMVWFMNPAQEPLAYTQRAAYVIGDVREHRLPESVRFNVITCLSTLEHVGLDTKRYGGPGRRSQCRCQPPREERDPDGRGIVRPPHAGRYALDQHSLRAIRVCLRLIAQSFRRTTPSTDRARKRSWRRLSAAGRMSTRLPTRLCPIAVGSRPHLMMSEILCYADALLRCGRRFARGDHETLILTQAQPFPQTSYELKLPGHQKRRYGRLDRLLGPDRRARRALRWSSRSGHLGSEPRGGRRDRGDSPRPLRLPSWDEVSESPATSRHPLARGRPTEQVGCRRASARLATTWPFACGGTSG